MPKSVKPKEKKQITPDVVVEETSYAKPLLIGLAVITIIVLLVGGWYWVKNKKALKGETTSSQEKAKNDITQLVGVVGKLIELPKDELPTVATVSDKTKLQDQPFFAKAENGDRVLIYTDAKKALLYRPSSNKIIEVTSLNIDQTSQVSTETLSPTVSIMPRVAIYNATQKSGYANQTEQKLKESFPVEVVRKMNTAADVETILVVDITGKTGDASAKIAEILQGEIGQLPKDIEKPDADVLIILGR